MTIHDIQVRKDIILENVEYYEHGDLKGYVNAILVDNRDNKGQGYETLFRVFDPTNGPGMTLVSVDYGYELNDDSIITDVENKLREEMLNVLN